MHQAKRLAPVLVYILAIAIVFRTWLISGMDLGFGDRADGIIEISLLEHWKNTFSGMEVWNDPIYFWPHSDALGYNDGYLLFGVDYALWRLFTDPFRADMMNILLFKTVGFWGAFRLANNEMALGRRLALVIALLFTIASGLMRQAGHAQLQTIGLLPLAGILAIFIIRNEISGRLARARAAAASLAVLMAAWLMTAYYMAWFTLFFAIIFGLCWLVVSGNWRPARIGALAKAHSITAGVFVVILLTASVPFLLVYLPKASESGSHGLGEVKFYLTWFYDVFNTGEENYLWGWTLRPFRFVLERIGGADLADAKLRGENVSGFPLILLGLVIASMIRLAQRTQPPHVRAFAWSIGIGWLLTLQAGPLSPWTLVYWLVPGASGLRVVVRYQLFLILPALLLVGLAQRQRFRELSLRMPMVAGAMILLLIVEQFGPVTSAELSRAGQRGLLRTARPPRACTSFYVVTARTHAERYRNAEAESLYPHNVDAMLLASLWHIPTLNGFATFRPPDWNFADPFAANYDERALNFIRAHDLHGVCRLDARSNRPWSRID